MDTKNTKEKLSKTDIFLIIIGILLIIFTAIMIWLFYLYQNVPDALIAGFFGVTFGECGFCTLVYKIRKGAKTNELYTDNIS